MRQLKVGDKVLIINKADNPDYIGREGRITKIDSEGNIFGTWGIEPIFESVDEFTRISEKGSF